jgi:hypothetical protein
MPYESERIYSAPGRDGIPEAHRVVSPGLGQIPVNPNIRAQHPLLEDRLAAGTSRRLLDKGGNRSGDDWRGRLAGRRPYGGERGAGPEVRGEGAQILTTK